MGQASHPPQPVGTPTEPIRPKVSLRLCWPTDVPSWLGLIVLVGCCGYLYQREQFEVAAILFGIILNQLGVSGQQTAALTMAFRAAEHAAQAAQTAEVNASQTQEKLEVVKEAVKDIQENPALPGTPGWMDRNAPTPDPGVP